DLVSIASKYLSATESAWAVKDPIISQLIPLWEQIAADLQADIYFIMAVRHPQATVTSLCQNYKMQQNMAELIWLSRNTSMLDGLNHRFFVAHYENIISDTDNSLRDLASFCLVNPQENEFSERTVKPSLN